MPTNENASLTKEFPLSQYEKTINAIRPGMTLTELRKFARQHSQEAIAGLLAKRFLLVRHGTIVFDRFLTLVIEDGIASPRVRKCMFFLWCWRDSRLRHFITTRVATPTGEWRAQSLLDKANRTFFRDSGGGKARSNLEEYLAATSLLNRDALSIHLELEDGWLGNAVEIVSQHEPDAGLAHRLLHAPEIALRQDQLYRLANAPYATVAEALANSAPSENVNDDEAIVEPNSILVAPIAWRDRAPPPKGRSLSIHLVDEIKRERASMAHLTLERQLATKLVALGHRPLRNEFIDMCAVTTSGSLLVEIKSCNELNLHAQVRRGVAQLLEYRYLHTIITPRLLTPVTMMLLLETRPTGQKSWLVQYLFEIGICLAWSTENTLVLSRPLPPPFERVATTE